MALKYQIEYLDVVNTPHKFELYDDNYVGSVIGVDGSIVMDYGQVDENLEAIRGQGLRVDLEANQDLTFEDLFTEQEKTFKVIYYRDSVILFQGWLNPEGFFEDFVNDQWIVSFDCIDGLGYLENLAFVNSDGTNITGVKTQLEILSLALQRTGIEANINIDIDVFYTGLADTNSILENVKANTRRYIKDDDSTIMSCEEVIRDVIEPYGAVLTSYNGEWAIYKPNQLYLNTEAVFFRYDYLGIALSPATVTFEFGFDLGSQINDFYPHHCSGNQRFTNKPSFGAYRISYKYGLVKSLIENFNFYTADGLTYDEWNIDRPSLVTVPAAGEYGATILLDKFSSISHFDPVLSFDGITVSEGASFKATVKCTLRVPNTGLTYCRIVYFVAFDDGNNVYYSKNDGTWTTDVNEGGVHKTPSIEEKDTEFVFEYVTSAVFDDGELYIVLCQPYQAQNLITDDIFVDFRTVELTTEGDGGLDIKGEVFTLEREDNPSARIEKTREVATGDSNLDIYLGTLYQSDGATPTETWFRKDFVEAVPIISMMGSETMRMNQNTMRIFNGDVFGYFNYLSVVSIDGRAGQFGVTKYSYNTKENIISAEFKQLFGDELTDLDVEKTLDYGKVVEPTIRG